MSTDLEWNHRLPDSLSAGSSGSGDENNSDRYQPGSDNITTATHTTSSPISAIRTPDDYPALSHLHMQQQQFVKQLEGACFDLNAADVHSYSHAHAAAARFGMVPNDPFGLDASLFSI